VIEVDVEVPAFTAELLVLEDPKISIRGIDIFIAVKIRK
jgi:hypothetical protein